MANISRLLVLELSSQLSINPQEIIYRHVERSLKFSAVNYTGLRKAKV